jgi:hypothetical protein
MGSLLEVIDEIEKIILLQIVRMAKPRPEIGAKEKR